MKSNHRCSVPQCSNGCGNDISLHHFPKDEVRKQQWVVALRIEKTISKHMYVCSDHFRKEDFFLFDFVSVRRRLQKGIVPSQKLPSSVEEKDSTKTQFLARLDVDPTFEHHFVFPSEDALDTPVQFDDPLLNIKQEQDIFDSISTSEDIEMQIKQEINDTSHLEETYNDFRRDQFITSGPDCVVKQETNNEDINVNDNELFNDRKPCFECRYCDETFTATKNFIHHVGTCVKNPSVKQRLASKTVFSFCNATFKQNSSLKLHLEKHMKPYQCKYCNKTFELKEHVDQHNELRLSGEYRCRICELAFCSLSWLRYHEKQVYSKLIRCEKFNKHILK